MEKECKTCKQTLSLDQFWKSASSKDGHRSTCKKCLNERRNSIRKENGFYSAENRRANRERYAEYYKQYDANRKTYWKHQRQQIKIRAFAKVSKKILCASCGCDDLRCLSIDHINGNGAEERRKLGIKGGGRTFYQHILRTEDVSNYQILCMNCQFIKRHENNECC